MARKGGFEKWYKELTYAATEMSRSASENITAGDLPPSSRVTFFRLEAAAAWATFFPVATEPVKEILPILMFRASRSPVLPSPEITFTRPAGNPASFMSSATFKTYCESAVSHHTGKKLRESFEMCTYSKRCLLTRLDNDRISSHERRRNLHGKHDQRNIPGDDGSYHTIRLLQG